MQPENSGKLLRQLRWKLQVTDPTDAVADIDPAKAGYLRWSEKLKETQHDIHFAHYFGQSVPVACSVRVPAATRNHSFGER